MDTIKHKSIDELIDRVRGVVQDKKASRIVVGLPLLPGGATGEQATYVHALAGKLKECLGIDVELIDERYSSSPGMAGEDADAKAACALLTVAIERKKK